jgi:hypothetical protein
MFRFPIRCLAVAAVIIAGGLTRDARGQASYPMVMDIWPLAVQAGSTAEHRVTARYNLYGTYQVFVTGNGVKGEAAVEPAKADPAKPEMKKEEPKKDESKKDAAKPTETKTTEAKTTEAKPATGTAAAKPAEPAKKPDTPKLQVRFAAAADALPGVREFRLATPQGLSTVGQVVVVLDPVITETGKNDTMAAANPVTLPAAICGTIEAAEDVDHFKFHVKAGRTVTFHCRSARCEDKIHDLQAHVDPIMFVKNEAGVVLAANDNFFYGDPLLSHTFKDEGDYYLEIRDVRYQGNIFWQYVVEANERPFATTAVPAVVKRGAKTTVEVVGFNLPAGTKAELDVPAATPEGTDWIRPRLKDGTLLNPVQVLVSDGPIVAESAAEKAVPAKAQDISVPAVVAGRIGKPGEADCFAFAAKKNDKFLFEVTARRLQSSLDSIIAVYDEQGKRLVEGDDVQIHRMLYSDSILDTWAAPADGKYVVEIRDLHLRGGDGFGYALKVDRILPHFVLHTDLDKVLVPSGVGGQVFVKTVRKNGFNGEIQLGVEGLPKGIRAECGKILADGLDGCICFYAEPGTKPATFAAKIVGTGVHKEPAGKDANGKETPAKETKFTTAAQAWQETYMPGGGRSHFPVDMFAVSVCDPLDITKVTVEPREVTLKPGESKKLEITIERAEGFDKNVTLDLIYRHLASPFGNSLPAGVTIDDKQSKTLLTAKELKGHITLTAAKDAKPVEQQIVPVMAQAAINFVMKMSYCAEPLRVTVKP